MILPTSPRLRHASHSQTPADQQLSAGRLFVADATASLTTSVAREPEMLTRNWFLGTLPEAERAELLPHLETVKVEHRQPLFDAGRPVEYVYFPETATISMVGLLLRDGSVAVATV